MKNSKESIVFLDSEIVDDYSDAPLGVLISPGIHQVTSQEKKSVKEAQTDTSLQYNIKGSDTTCASAQYSYKEASQTAPLLDAKPKTNDKKSKGAKLIEQQSVASLDTSRSSFKNYGQQSLNASLSSTSFDIDKTETAQIINKPAKKAPVASEAQDSWKAAKIDTTSTAKQKKANSSKTVRSAKHTSDNASGVSSNAKTEASHSDSKKTQSEAHMTQKSEVSKASKSTSTKVENKTNNTMEAKKVAKTEKTAKAAPAEEKAVAKKAATKVEETKETVIIAGDDSIPHGKFVIKKTDKGNFVYKLYSYNHRVVAIGAEQYGALSTCKGGIQSVIKNAATAPIEDQTLRNVTEQKCPKWVIYLDKKEEFRLRLIASNGNIVCTTNDGYLSKDAAKKGIEAIGRAANGADVVRNDDLW